MPNLGEDGLCSQVSLEGAGSRSFMLVVTPAAERGSLNENIYAPWVQMLENLVFSVLV